VRKDFLANKIIHASIKWNKVDYINFFDNTVNHAFKFNENAILLCQNFSRVAQNNFFSILTLQQNSDFSLRKPQIQRLHLNMDEDDESRMVTSMTGLKIRSGISYN
jgi:hypothetical protein